MVLVMKATEDRHGDDAVAIANPMAGRHWRKISGIRHAGSEARVRTPAIVVRGPLPKDSAKVTLVERHHPVQAFPTNCVHDAFTERVRLRRSHRCLENGGTHRRDCPIDSI